MAESPAMLWLERAPPRALISVRLDPAADSHWVGEALGVEWRSQPLKLHHAQRWRWWSTSPGIWLIEGTAEDEARLHRLLESAGVARPALVTVVSDAWAGLRLSGSARALADLFERAGPVGSEALAGRCLATRLGAFAVTLFESPSAGEGNAPASRQIELHVERPLLGSLEQWLIRLGAQRVR